jgi:hypothetical protein
MKIPSTINATTLSHMLAESPGCPDARGGQLAARLAEAMTPA